MKVQLPISVSHQFTSDVEVAKVWLGSLPSLFAADFECALRYTNEEVETAKLKMSDMAIPKLERIKYQVIANATALSHPYHCTITHCSIAYSESEAYVFVIDNQEIADVVLGFLTSTESKQIWHNYCYDGRFLCYYGNGNAKDVEDTQIFAKTLLNHVEIFKAKTALKLLMGNYYGDWGISADNFTLAQQHDPVVIKYAAIDACATYKLWDYLNEYIKEQP
jgi:hypothetical protein